MSVLEAARPDVADAIRMGNDGAQPRADMGQVRLFVDYFLS